MALWKPNKVTEFSKPQIIEDAVSQQFVTVTRDSITIGITSTENISRTISYTEVPKFRDVNEVMHRIGLEEKGIQIDEWKEHNCDRPLVIPLNEYSYGSHFTFRVLGRHKESGTVTENYVFPVRAELTKFEMGVYLNYILNRIDPEMEEGFFYRNFNAEDEKRCIETNNGYFEMSLKERSGHRSSPLYRRLDNITFFSCKLFRIKWEDRQKPNHQKPYLPVGFKHPPMSPFGAIRLSFDANKLLNENSVLFLAGMHCYDPYEPKDNWAHYVSVVVCQKGSISYYTCLEKGLMEMSWHNNPILQWDKKTGKIKCASKLKWEDHQVHSHDVWVEIILCDQPVALADGHKSTDDFDYKKSATEHKSSVTCQTCHGYKTPVPVISPLKRRSHEQNSETPEKVMKENV